MNKQFMGSVGLLVVLFGAAAVGGVNPDGNLRIEIATAYNFVVDSNVESPSTYAPRSAYLSATFHNDGATTMTNVYAYIGNHTNGVANTPGIYPSRAHPPLVGPLPGSEFALTHEGGSAGGSDAIRYIGDLGPGDSVTVYWLVSYPNLDENGDSVTGPSIKPDDDLWLEYDIWGTAQETGVDLEACQTRKVTMRSEISAAANKIAPNGANKVPDEYKEALNEFNVSWTNTFSDGSPGTKIWTDGIWYDLGNVGEGFDNDGDFVPDHNAWMQPVGDPTLFDPASFRLIRTYAMVIVKLKGGGEDVTIVEDQLYFENIPDNNGAVGIVRYEFLSLKPGGSSVLSPYQEVASGRDNEKFNGDYGATLGGDFVSATTAVELTKSADLLAVNPSDAILYTVAYTNPGALALGQPSLGIPLVIQDSIPTGTLYVAGSAATGNTLPLGVSTYTVLYSTNDGSAWLTVEPTVPTDVTDLQWWLSDALGTNTAGEVTFSSTVTAPYTNTSPRIFNEAGLSFGSTTPFLTADAESVVLGTNDVGDTVFLDDGNGAGTIGDGIQNGTESGISDVTVWLYYDVDGDGAQGAIDVLVNTTVTDVTGMYLFTNVTDGSFVVVVDALDADLPFGAAVSSPTAVATDLDLGGTTNTTVSFLDADFGFVPVLALDKTVRGATTTVTNRESDLLIYDLVVTNRLTLNGTAMVYEVWATNINEVAFYSSLSAWSNTNNIVQPTAPDGLFASVVPAGGADKIGLEGFRLAAQSGSITNVEIVFPVQQVGGWANDEITFNLYTNSDGAAAAAFSTNMPLSSLAVGTYELVWNVTTNRAWDWADFSDTGSNVLQIIAGKVSGPDGSTSYHDQAGFRIYTDSLTSGTNPPSLTLNPVPLTDTYDTGKLEYVSSTLSPDSVTDGVISWGNVGPLGPGDYETISVTFRVLEPPNNSSNNVTNVAAVVNAFYGDGRPANSATDIVESVVLPAGTIGDFVWRDINSDGVQDGGAEVGIGGVTVVLTPPGGIDLGNGAGGAVTSVTDSAGAYLFEGIPADGSYTVSVTTVTLPGGSGTATYDEDSGTTSPDDVTVVVMTHDATDGTDTHLSADFGYTVSEVIEGTIWNDVNQDGGSAPDSGESWLSGVTVYLFAGAVGGTPGSELASTTTDANGYYQFVGAYVGTYSVQIATGTGDMTSGTWTQSFDTDGAGTSSLVAVTVVSGGSAIADYSYYQTGAYSLGDTLFYDWDGDGVQDASDEGIPNVTVYLYEDEDGDGVVDLGVDALIASDVTDSSGTYLFPLLASTNYHVVVDQADPDLPSLYTVTADPDVVLDNESSPVIAGASDLDQDFGMQPYGDASIGDTVWNDFNGNGTQSGPLEVGLSNITVTLYSDFNLDGIYVSQAVTTTDASGNYLFGSLPAGDYRVEVDTADGDLPTDFFGINYFASTDSQVDQSLTNDQDYLDADFGFAPYGALGDRIFWDANTNGTEDFTEIGATGVTVNLYLDVNGNGYFDSGVDTFSVSDVTDSNGYYLFTALAPDDYVVVVDTNSGEIVGAPLMADPSSDGEPAWSTNAVDADSEYGVTITAGGNFMGADFGYEPAGVVGDTLWLDTDNDGVRGALEIGLAYVGVSIWSGGVMIATNETDADGTYLFSGMVDGTYYVIVDTADPDFMAGVAQVYDPDAAMDSVGTNIVISGGVVTSIGGVAGVGISLDVDFGYRFTGTNSLSGTIGLETVVTNGVMGTTGSGVDPDEIPFAGEIVYLIFWQDDGDAIVQPGETIQIASTVTDANGDYSFTGLPTGDLVNDAYIVSLAAPEDDLFLSTTVGVTPATLLSNNVDVVGNTISAWQAVLIAPTITNMDFAFVSTARFDWGDLPSSYGVQRQDTPEGPRHRISNPEDLYLGATVIGEPNGQPSVEADGDGSEEDGVAVIGVWQDGTNSAQVRVTIGAGDGWLVGFVDYNNDGDMSDAGEMVISEAVSSTGSGGGGVYTNTFTVSAGAISPTNMTTLYARFRLFPNEVIFPQFAYGGAADNGEVEDYLFRFGSIGDFVWKDANGDDVRDPWEPGITNVRVFVDLNADGLFDAGEPYTFTDDDGAYHIGGFSTGSWDIVVESSGLPANTDPSYDLDGILTPHTAVVELTNGQVRVDADFGYASTIIGGLVWLDLNVNGIQDEIPLDGVSNVIVRLFDDATNLIATTETDMYGMYLFDDPAAGNYFVEFMPIGYLVSPVDQGADDTVDSDGAVGTPYRTAIFGVTNGVPDMTRDLGVYQTALANSIGDQVWNDLNQNGLQDGGAETGLVGVVVHLYDAGMSLLNSRTTDVGGLYFFPDLAAGNYFVKFVPPTSYAITLQDVGGDHSIDSDADPSSGLTAAISIIAGQIINTIDAGMFVGIDLGVFKTVDNATPAETDSVLYTVVVTNNGPGVASSIVFTDALPAGVTYVSNLTSQGTYDDVGDTWDIGSIAFEGFATLIMAATVDAGAGGSVITNTASLLSLDQSDTILTNNSDSAIITVELPPDLGVFKTVNDATPAEGDVIVYTIVVTNNGPGVMTGISITDVVPAGVTFSNATVSVGSYNSGSGIWSIGSLIWSNSASLVITGGVDVGTAGSVLTNTASLTASDQTDTVLTNNSDSAVITIDGADLCVTKSVDIPTPLQAVTVTFTIVVTNLGPVSATNVELTDILPVGLTYSADTPTSGSFDSGSGVWTIGTILPNGSETLSLEASIDMGTDGLSITNAAWISASDVTDPNPNNNTNSAVVLVSGLSFEKLTDLAVPAKAGDVITYTLKLTNDAATIHPHVEVTDVLPAGLTYVSGSATNIIFRSQNQEWYLDEFGAIAYTNSDGLIEFTKDWQEIGEADGPTTGNVTVSADGAEQYALRVLAAGMGAYREIDLSSHTNATLVFGYRRVDFDGAQAGLTMDVSTDNGVGWTTVMNFPVGTDASYVYVTNDLTAYIATNTWIRFLTGAHGQNDDNDVYIDDFQMFVPRDISVTTNAGSAPPTMLSEFTLLGGDAVDIIFQVTVDDPLLYTEFINVGSVTSSVQTIPIDKSVTNFPAFADLGILKSVSDLLPNEGDTIAYTMVVTNNGPQDATGVTYSDVLPNGVTFVSEDSESAYTNGVWTIGMLTVGSSTTLVVNVSVDSGTVGTAITNTMALTHVNDIDSVATNNTNSATFRVPLMDLGVLKTVSDANPEESDVVQYTLVVTNSGPDDATGVTYSDVLPSGVTYQTDDSGGDYLADVWTIGVLPANVSTTLVIDVSIDVGSADKTITNDVSLASYNEADDVATNNAASAILSVVGIVDLGVTKVIDDVGPGTNEIMYYTIVLTNNGPHAATSIELTDTWPIELNYMSDFASVGSYDNTTKKWDGFNLAAAGSATLVITGRLNNVATNLTVTNTITITGLDQIDTDPSNDTDEAILVSTLAIVHGFDVAMVGQTAVVVWHTASEIGTVGFNLFRRKNWEAEFTPLNAELLPGLFNSPQGGAYQFVDDSAQAGQRYDYLLEEREVTGGRRLHGPYRVRVGDGESAGINLLKGRYSAKAAVQSHEQEARLERAQGERIEKAARRKRLVTKRLNAKGIMGAGNGGSIPSNTRGLMVVNHDGLYRLNADVLAATLRLEPGGVVQQIQQGKVRIGAGDREIPYESDSDGGGLMFYAQNPGSLYATSTVLWVDFEKGSEVSTRLVSDSGANAVGASFATERVFEEDQYANVGAVSSVEEDYWFWDYAAAGHPTIGTREFMFDVPGHDPAQAASIEIVLHGATAIGVTDEHHIVLRLNGEPIAEVRWDGRVEKRVQAVVNSASIQAVSNRLEMVAIRDAGVSYSYVYMNRIILRDHRLYQAQEGALTFSAERAGSVDVGGFVTNTVNVWDVTDPAAPLSLSGFSEHMTGETVGVRFDGLTAGARYIAADAFGVTAIEDIRLVPDSHLKDRTNAYEYVIITVSDLFDEAQTLAAYREAKGLRSIVVTMSELYDQFGNGNRHPRAIRTFLEYAHDQWSVGPRYVLLAGGGTYDYRDLGGVGDNLVPPMMVSTPAGLFASDGSYVDFDEDGVPEMAIGRLPVVGASELGMMIEKIKGYESHPQEDWTRRVVTVADNRDDGGNFPGAVSALKAGVPFPEAGVDIDLGLLGTTQARSDLLAAWGSGAVFVNYLGHGAPNRLANEGLLVTGDVAGMTNQTTLPVLTALSCVVGRFEMPAYDSLGEELVLKEGGGAIAVIAASGMTMNYASALVGEGFYRARYEDGVGVLGDVFSAALAHYSRRSPSKVLPRLYNLMGDPALLLAGADAGYEASSGTGFEGWRKGRYTPAERQLMSGSVQHYDGDGDGVSDLMEYALGRNPHRREADRVWSRTELEGDKKDRFLVLSFPRRRSAGDVEYQIQASQNLKTWVSNPGYVEFVSVVADAGRETETVTFRVRVTGATPRLFFRLAVRDR